jgi:hypothetical protein
VAEAVVESHLLLLPALGPPAAPGREAPTAGAD